MLSFIIAGSRNKTNRGAHLLITRYDQLDENPESTLLSLITSSIKDIILEGRKSMTLLFFQVMRGRKMLNCFSHFNGQQIWCMPFDLGCQQLMPKQSELVFQGRFRLRPELTVGEAFRNICHFPNNTISKCKSATRDMWIRHMLQVSTLPPTKAWYLIGESQTATLI